MPGGQDAMWQRLQLDLLRRGPGVRVGLPGCVVVRYGGHLRERDIIDDDHEHDRAVGVCRTG